MRIITGSLKGRTFLSPPGRRTHPMSDRIRGALFNILGDVSGLKVLDPFAGSGALSFESVSRGAKQATAIEQDKKAQDVINENIIKLGVDDKVKLISGNCKSWSHNNPEKQFDLVFCDPPYDAVPVSLIEQLSGHVKSGGVLILSWPSFLETPELDGFTLASQKRYGNAQLIFFTR